MQRRRQRTAEASSGDAEDRVALIYEQYAGRVAAYALRRTSRSDAADAVAETFLVAWRRRDDVPDEPNTLPWLYGVTRRVLANQHRTQRRRSRLADRLASEFAMTEVELPPLEEIEEFRRVAAAINDLSDNDAELLRLTAWEALSPREIATAFGIPPGTARQRLSRARQRLRDHLAAEQIEAGAGGAARPASPAPVPAPDGDGVRPARKRPGTTNRGVLNGIRGVTP